MARRRIKKAKIDFISLCPRGANGFGVIYKEEDNTFRLETVVKELNGFEKGELVAVVYAPEITDSQGDVASAEVIKEMMYDAAKRGEAIDIRHNNKALPKDAAFVAERFIIQKDDPRFYNFTNYNGDKVDVTGGWGTVIKIDDPALRQEYRDGKWNGVSMGGTAMFETVKSDEDVEEFTKALRRVLGKETTDSGDLDMDAKELTILMEKNNSTLAAAIVTGLQDAGVIKKAETPEEKNTRLEKEIEDLKSGKKKPVKKGDEETEDDDKAPVFKGDPSDVEALTKHARALQIFKLREGVDFADAEQVAEFVEKLNEFKKAGKENLTPEQEKVKKLEEEIKKIKGGSNRPVTKSNDDDDDEITGYEGMSKEDRDLFQLGSSMAEGCNILNGSVVQKSA